MHSKLSNIALLIVLFTTIVFSQTKDVVTSLDSLIIKKNASLILNYNLNSKELSKKGIDFTAKYYNNRDIDKYSLFNIPVKSIEVILVDNILISLEIKLEETNERIENIEKALVKYIGNYNTERSKKTGSSREVYFGEKDNYFMLDASLITDNNMGHLSVGYITQEFIELVKKMKQNNSFCM